ncbi:hypothetical protein [Aggregatibacter sp. Marseille-P9115]|jgi:hypothetical protein|uniref:hypothetical protein n=1 Tax=Aggregatibacter sp. Marseille-P9115 TaxID=2866570 RepID=UPI001E4F00E9|nr:hypothetical protein [Aggregatibacter sp. Marseille-P9115]DAP90682.1 MAG TPA: hypothetical protein [Caudoviricetes sp.]
MTEIKLNNPEAQEKLTALLDEFNRQKADLMSLDEELKLLEGKQAKNKATLSAVNNESESKLAEIKAKFETTKELTLDDYTESQKIKVELKSRADFFNAIGEELEAKIYSQREQVFNTRNRLLEVRKKLILFYGEALADEFIQQHRAQIALFKSLIISGVSYDPVTEKDGKDVFNEMLTQKLAAVKESLPDEFKLPALNLDSDWKPKTPTEIHLEQFQPQEEKGFKRLLNNM